MQPFDIARDPCPECGRPPRAYKILNGWQPCWCGGHETRRCLEDAGGCGYMVHVPPLGESCRPPHIGFHR